MSCGRVVAPTPVWELAQRRGGGGAGPALTVGSPNEAKMAGLGILPSEGREKSTE